MPHVSTDEREKNAIIVLITESIIQFNFLELLFLCNRQFALKTKHVVIEEKTVWKSFS